VSAPEALVAAYQRWDAKPGDDVRAAELVVEIEKIVEATGRSANRFVMDVQQARRSGMELAAALDAAYDGTVPGE
jgi:hypothetical protein